MEHHRQSEDQVITQLSELANVVDSIHSEMTSSLETTYEQLKETMCKQKEELTKSVTIAKDAWSREVDRKCNGEVLESCGEAELISRVKRIEEKFTAMERRIGIQDYTSLVMDDQVIYVYNLNSI